MVPQVLMQQSSAVGNAKHNNFHSLVEQTQKLPKEPRGWITKQEFHLKIKHLQVDARLSDPQDTVISSCFEKAQFPLTWFNIITGYTVPVGL